MAIVLIKRGQQADISNLTLVEGELALAYNADKTSIALYAGDGNGGKVLVNPDVSEDITGVRSFEDLPENARKYIERIETLVGVPVKFIGTGAGREDMIIVE